MATESLYCVCGQPYDAKQFMIQCDACREWFHGSCVGVWEYISIDLDKYHCPQCEKTCGPSIFRKQNNWHRHNYSEMDAESKPVQTGTPVFVEELKTRHFPSADPVITRLKGHELTISYLIEKGFDQPILVESSEGLGIKVPHESLTVQDIEKLIGTERKVRVIDVATQAEITMRFGDFVTYFNNPKRLKVLNMISLEFSTTKLNPLVEAPLVARNLDWANTVWPSPEVDDGEYSKPEVQKYCLIGAKDSYTDFHIDFGGTSVWYHVLTGEKVFYLIEPTNANLSLYTRWYNSTTSNETFFGDQVDRCYSCVLKAGHTMLIPTGWIHAVLTPVDTLVFGGNFLHNLNIPMQLRVFDIEKKTKTPAKYRYPCFQTINWYAARSLCDELQKINEKGSQVPTYLLRGVKALLFALKQWNQERDNAVMRSEPVPPSVQGPRFIKTFSKEIRAAEKIMNSLNPPKPERESKRKKKKPVNKDFVDFSHPLHASHQIQFSIMEVNSEELAIKQEIKEEEEVSFELIEDQSYSLESVKEESLCSEIKRENSLFHVIDNQSYSVADLIKEEDIDDNKMNEKIEFIEEEINCEWSETLLNEPDPLDLSEFQGMMQQTKEPLKLSMKVLNKKTPVIPTSPAPVATPRPPLKLTLPKPAMYPYTTLPVKPHNVHNDNNNINSSESKSWFIANGNAPNVILHPEEKVLKVKISKVPDSDIAPNFIQPRIKPKEEIQELLHHTFLGHTSTVLNSNHQNILKPIDSIYDFHDESDNEMDENCLTIDETPRKKRWSKTVSPDRSNAKVKSKHYTVLKINKKPPSESDLDLSEDSPKNGIAELIKASCYTRDHSPRYEGLETGRTSPSTREAIAGMLSISRMFLGDKETSSSSTTSDEDEVSQRRRKRQSSQIEDFDENMDKVHQDEDYIYPSLDLSDDEEPERNGKMNKRKIDEAWNPKARVGHVTPKTDRPCREGARKQAVEKGLEAAAAKRAGLPPPKRAYYRKKPKLIEPEPQPSSSTSSPFLSPMKLSLDLKGQQRKPKKGMATAKQRLGRILKIHKMIH